VAAASRRCTVRVHVCVCPRARVCVAGCGGVGGGRVAGAVPAGGSVVSPLVRFFFFFSFRKNHSPRANFASRRISTDGGPACSRRRRLRRYSWAERPSPRGKTPSARATSLSAKGSKPVVDGDDRLCACCAQSILYM
jgi:hypothetical protein